MGAACGPPLCIWAWRRTTLGFSASNLCAPAVMSHAQESPRFVAVVVALSYDFSAAKFENDGEVCANGSARRERIKRDGERAFPENFKRDGVSVGDFVADFV